MSLSSLFGGGGGAFIGAAAVELVGDIKPLVASLEKGKVETKAASDTMKKSTTGFSTVAIAAYAIAGAALVKFAASAIQAAEQHQVALTNLSVAAKGNAAAFADLASKQVALTGFREDDIIAAETQLARLNLTADQMKILLGVSEDYARATGRDLPQAAGLLEKAMLGNARATKELGFAFKATGNFAKDFGTLTSAAQAKVGGSAAAYLKTTAGQLQLLSAQYDQLKIQVGQGLTPAFIGLLHAALALMPIIRALGYIILSVVGVAELFVAGIQDINATFKDLGHTILDFLGISHGNGEAIDHLGKSYRATNQIIGDYIHQTDIAKISTGNYSAAQQTAADSAAYLAKQQKAAAAAATAQKNAEDALKGGLLGLVAAQAQVVSDQKALNDLRKQGKTGTVDYSNAELQLLQDQLGLTQSTKDYLKNLRTSGDTQKQVVAEIVAMGKAVGLTKEQIDKLLGAYLNAYNQMNKHPLSAALGASSGFLQGKLAGGSGYGGTSGGTTVHNTNVSVHVAGSVTTQSDLVKAIQTSLLRQKARNAGVLGL